MNLPSNKDFIDIHVHNPGNNEFCIRNHFAQDIDPVFNPGYPCSIGLHPWHIGDDHAELVSRLAMAAGHKQVFAIGETGLDKTIHIPLQLQEEVFLAQLQLAERVEKPVIIHCVKAYSELIHIRIQHPWKMPWIMHWFNANLQIANQLMEAGCYLSFGRSLLHPNGKNASVFTQVDPGKVFFETDDAGISIAEVYSKASSLCSMDMEGLKQRITDNFNAVFRFQK